MTEPTETTRKWRLFQLLLYSVLANVPDELWTNHREEIERMRIHMGHKWDQSHWGNMERGVVWEWVKTQAIEIWDKGTNEWYEKNVKTWLEREKIVW